MVVSMVVMTSTIGSDVYDHHVLLSLDSPRNDDCYYYYCCYCCWWWLGDAIPQRLFVCCPPMVVDVLNDYSYSVSWEKVRLWWLRGGCPWVTTPPRLFPRQYHHHHFGGAV
jgi:hypothetical protein